MTVAYSCPDEAADSDTLDFKMEILTESDLPKYSLEARKGDLLNALWQLSGKTAPKNIIWKAFIIASILQVSC